MKINNNYISDTTPSKNGVYNVRYTRAKSTKVVEGTARFSKRPTSEFAKGWSGIINSRTGRHVGIAYDRRDARAYHPAVQAWAVAK